MKMKLEGKEIWFSAWTLETDIFPIPWYFSLLQYGDTVEMTPT